jgi:hypothetical protein
MHSSTGRSTKRAAPIGDGKCAPSVQRAVTQRCESARSGAFSRASRTSGARTTRSMGGTSLAESERNGERGHEFKAGRWTAGKPLTKLAEYLGGASYARASTRTPTPPRARSERVADDDRVRSRSSAAVLDRRSLVSARHCPRSQGAPDRCRWWGWAGLPDPPRRALVSAPHRRAEPCRSSTTAQTEIARAAPLTPPHGGKGSRRPTSRLGEAFAPRPPSPPR